MSSGPQSTNPHATHLRCVQLVVRGAVQGVGFRPFVYRLASELGLRGWVSNSAGGVLIEIEGSLGGLEIFLNRLKAEKPEHALLQSLDYTWLPGRGYSHFEIRQSEGTDNKRALVLPDLATCSDCVREIFDPANRRFQYPFTNCTHCGPRFTIVEALPYDRIHTSMRTFPMCSACQAEYDNPRDRRFHAQPNACPVCGPRLELWKKKGERLKGGHEGLCMAATALRDGLVVAVKGLGGFHLMVAAHRTASVGRLRQMKRREEKPFALMFPSIKWVQEECDLSSLEEELLRSAQAPIVLLQRSKSPTGRSGLSPLLAPGNPYLGVMLPSTPLHHLLMDLLRFPVVATSGNLSEEPLCTDEHEAVQRLGGVADLFLVHNRPIVRHADDSIVRVVAGREMMLRRARGYAPLPVTVACGDKLGGPETIPAMLAVGAHLKNTIALAIGDNVFVSQHIGDLETPQALTAFKSVIADFQKFYAVQPKIVATDAHPDYRPSRYAAETRRSVLQVQHHYAHVLSCMAEHGLTQNVLGVSWDGTGLGTDGTIWGGEFLTVGPHSFERFAHWRTFRLPGGDKAAREPRRSALGLLFEVFGEAVFQRRELAPVAAFSNREFGILERMFQQQLNTPITSSAGRLFDAVAAILGLRQRAEFEGQAAMELEFSLAGVESDEDYPLGQTEMGVLDWGPMIFEILQDLRKELPVGLISIKVHNSLAEAIVQIAEQAGQTDVVLSGGCFQNKYLTERAVRRLQQAGFRPYWHRRIPPNDGGIALGQVMAARRLSRPRE